MKLRQYEGNHWQLQQLDLATIRSLTPRNELLQPCRGKSLAAWSGYRANMMTKPWSATSTAAVAAPGNWATTCWALPSAPCASNTTMTSPVHLPGGGFNTGLLWKNPLGNLSLEAKGDYFTNGEVRRSLSLNQQWELSRNLGLRLSAQREFSHLATPENEVMLEVKWYHY
jgi:hypothetical protein